MKTRELEKWVPVPTRALTEHIINYFHVRLRQKLPEINRLFEEVLSDPFSENKNLNMAYLVYKEFAQELEFHLLREEQVLFPLMATVNLENPNYNLDFLVAPLSSMESDHLHDYEVMLQIKNLTCNLTAPSEASPPLILLYQEIVELFDELDLHIQIENEILFKRFKPTRVSKDIL